VDETNVPHKPILISGEKGNAVLISQTDWNSIQETLYLMSIHNMTESIIEAAATPLEKCVAQQDITIF